MVRKCYEKLHSHQLDNVDENEHLLESHQLSKLTQEEERIPNLFYETQRYSGTPNRK